MKYKLSKYILKQEQLTNELRRRDQIINDMKYYNGLTKLPNRNKLIELLHAAIHEDLGTEKAVIRLDIDRFHVINELYGWEIGNRLLIQIAERLQNMFGEVNTVFHESEDEFFILLDDVTCGELDDIGQIILNCLTQSFCVEGRFFYITASIGISHCPGTAENMTDLLFQAEIAMYNVKNNNKDNYEIYVPKEASIIERKKRIEFDLHEAIHNDQLYLVYQPQIDFKSGQVHSMEALLRWKHPELGELSPAEFIPIAEESGIIIEVGYWVNNEVIRQTKEWHDQGSKVTTSVNVSVAQFNDRHFMNYLLSLLHTHDLNPRYLIIEVTESESIVKNVKAVEDILKELKNNNIRIAIDDFGTGYSALSVLNNIFVDIIKLDKSFIDNIPEKSAPSVLVKSIIEMAHSMHLAIVAEGIEKSKQAQFLSENNCDIGQGYLFSEPLLVEDVIAFVKQNHFAI